MYSSSPIKLYGSEISNNIIGSTLTNPIEQPRIGIHLSRISNVNIKTNSILFHHDAAPNDPHLGIWLENCSEVRISDVNNIQNFTNFQQGTFGSSLTGLRLDASPMLCIENNTFTKLGIGMQVTGNSIINSLYQNIFTDFDAGINLSAANIGPNGGTENPLNLGSGNVMGNEWYLCGGCSTITKIQGNLAGNLLTWYTEVSSGDRYPDNDNVTGLTIDQIVSTSENSECQLTVNPPVEDDGDIPISLTARNAYFGGVVADSNRYVENYYNEFRYQAQQVVFGLLKKYPGMIIRDDDSDTSFISFYNDRLESNINKIDSLESLFSNGFYIEADTLLNHFADTNEIEHNYKRVYRLYIKQQLYGDTSLSNSDLDELNAIAYEHPLTAGHAVFAARNMLNLEVHDGELSSSSNDESKQTGRNKKLFLYPNPAIDYLRIKLIGAENIEEINIFDITGRIIFQAGQTDLVNTSEFSSVFTS
ncbi:MAG: T9SS type A sorting domain-containing protein [Bacteroidetes bacterium]|nr:T9SS type A sorting domain-containing protein [Bacteroidota bacterium]